MDLNEIKQILDLVREHELAEFEIEHDGLRLKVRKDTNGAHAVTPSALMVAPVIAPAAAEGAPAAREPSGGRLAQALDFCDQLAQLERFRRITIGVDFLGPSPGILGGRHDDDAYT